MPNATIRDATAADREALVDLKLEMNRAEYAARPSNATLKSDRDLSRDAAAAGVLAYWGRVHGNRGRFLVAEIDGAIVGCVCWYRGQASASVKHQYREQGTISGLVVSATTRRSGLGRLLLAEAERQIKSAGLSRVALSVIVDNAAAQDLYRKSGYEPTEITMLKALA